MMKVMNKILLVLGVLFLAVFLGISYWFLKASSTPTSTASSEFTLDYSEGNCKTDTDCSWAAQGCGGGHGICTDKPDSYKDTVSTCDVVPNFPSNKGFACGCVADVGKCGWKK